MSTQTIVIANSDPIYLAMAQDVLTDEGYRHVVCVADGEAPDAIRRLQPDLVLLDVQRQHKAQGQNLLDWLWSDPATKAIPVIICSTDPRLLKQQAAWLNEHRCALLEKPFTVNDLISTVQSFIGQPIVANT